MCNIREREADRMNDLLNVLHQCNSIAIYSIRNESQTNQTILDVFNLFLQLFAGFLISIFNAFGNKITNQKQSFVFDRS